MISRALSLVIGSTIGKWAFAAAAAAIISVSAWGGYQVSNALWEAKESRALEDYLISLEAVDSANRERERQLIVKLSKDRATVRTVIREIPTYITPDGCSINGDGVRHIRGQVADLFPSSKRGDNGPR